MVTEYALNFLNSPALGNSLDYALWNKLLYSCFLFQKTKQSPSRKIGRTCVVLQAYVAFMPFRSVWENSLVCLLLTDLTLTFHPFAGASVLGTVNKVKICTCYVSVNRV